MGDDDDDDKLTGTNWGNPGFEPTRTRNGCSNFDDDDDSLKMRNRQKRTKNSDNRALISKRRKMFLKSSDSLSRITTLGGASRPGVASSGEAEHGREPTPLQPCPHFLPPLVRHTQSLITGCLNSS